jgi:hypothetical protein
VVADVCKAGVVKYRKYNIANRFCIMPARFAFARIGVIADKNCRACWVTYRIYTLLFVRRSANLSKIFKNLTFPEGNALRVLNLPGGDGCV